MRRSEWELSVGSSVAVSRSPKTIEEAAARPTRSDRRRRKGKSGPKRTGHDEMGQRKLPPKE